jgi:hypothetical protein
MQDMTEATGLIALDDAQLDGVAGGCGHRGHFPYFGGSLFAPTFNITFNIIDFRNNNINADDVAIAFDQQANASKQS